MTSFHIVPATIDRIPLIRALIQSALIADDRFADTAQLERYLNRVYSPDSLKRTIENTGTVCLLAIRNADAAVIGFIQFGSPLLEACTDRKEIHRLYLHPDQVLVDVGGALVSSAVETLALDREVRQLFVYISAGDTDRLTFFEAQGFQHESAEDRDDDRYLVRDL